MSLDKSLSIEVSHWFFKYPLVPTHGLQPGFVQSSTSGFSLVIATTRLITFPNRLGVRSDHQSRPVARPRPVEGSATGPEIPRFSRSVPYFFSSCPNRRLCKYEVGSVHKAGETAKYRDRLPGNGMTGFGSTRPRRGRDLLRKNVCR